MLFPLKIEEENLKGHVVLTVPTYSERMALISELNLKVSTEGEVEISSDALSSMGKIFTKVKNYVQEVKVEATGEIFSGPIDNLEDLCIFEEGAAWVNEKLVKIVLSGIRLGKI